MARRIVERIAWTSMALVAACSAGPADRGAARPVQVSPGAAVSADVAPPGTSMPAEVPSVAAAPAASAATDAGAPSAPDPEVKACAAAMHAGMSDYNRFFSSRTPDASARLILRTFAKACRGGRFAPWAEAADRASRVGRAERSRILGRAAVGVCPGAETASAAADLFAVCPQPDAEAAPLLWKQLDAGTYAFVYALTHAGLDRSLFEELILQSSLAAH